MFFGNDLNFLKKTDVFWIETFSMSATMLLSMSVQFYTMYKCVTHMTTPAPGVQSAAIQLSSQDHTEGSAIIELYNGLSMIAGLLGLLQDKFHQASPDSLTGQISVQVSSFFLGIFLVTLPSMFIHDLLVQLMGVPVIPARNLTDIKQSQEMRETARMRAHKFLIGNACFAFPMMLLVYGKWGQLAHFLWFKLFGYFTWFVMPLATQFLFIQYPAKLNFLEAIQKLGKWWKERVAFKTGVPEPVQPKSWWCSVLPALLFNCLGLVVSVCLAGVVMRIGTVGACRVTH